MQYGRILNLWFVDTKREIGQRSTISKPSRIIYAHRYRLGID